VYESIDLRGTNNCGRHFQSDFNIECCVINRIQRYMYGKGKAIPVKGRGARGGPLGSVTSRIPHFLDNRLTDGGEVVSLTHRPHFYT
jgi:hypothetical protein